MNYYATILAVRTVRSLPLHRRCPAAGPGRNVTPPHVSSSREAGCLASKMLRFGKKNDATTAQQEHPADASLEAPSDDVENQCGSRTGSSSGSSSGKRSYKLATAALRDSSLLTTFQHVFNIQDLEGSSLDQETEVDADVEVAEDEGEKQERPERFFNRTHEYTNAFTVAIIVGLWGWCTYKLSFDIFVRLKLYYAAPIMVMLPIGMLFFSFGVQTLIKGLMSVGFGGTKPLEVNSQNYSAIKTPVPKGAKLPQIIVQMPVYKESLEEVIKLSYHNVRKAMDYYESKGGKTKYIICDDGFQVIPTDEALARANFYAKHNIAFVARPPQNRRGVFKKASNMNYQLSVSDRVTDLVKENPDLTPEQALVVVWDERDREFVAGGDLTIEEDCLILLIDADTKVPEHCMWDTAGEFIVDTCVAYTQHFTTPFDEQSRNFWEQYVSHFTRLIYTQGIAISTAYGDGSPLVGHNAFLRWASIREVGYTDESCRPGETKYWGESSVSEDFDMYMRLAKKNMFGRYVMYTGRDFQEGVSLTYMDEVVKFKKFAYGACEMCFNPFKEWPTKGPITRNLINYLKTPYIPWFMKASMFAYVSTYLAMGGAFYFTVFEAVMSVVDPGFHDRFMVRGFDVMLTCNFIFAGVGTICGNIIFEWRRKGVDDGVNIVKIVWNQFKWMPVSVLFFGSILFFITEACAMYLFSMKAVWGATAKEDKKTTCWQAFKDTIIGYKYEYILYFTLFGGYLFCLWYWNIGMYRGWSLSSYMAGHIVGPILLNPRIMTLSW